MVLSARMWIGFSAALLVLAPTAALSTADGLENLDDGSVTSSVSRGRGRGRPNLFRASAFMISNRAGNDEELGDSRGRGRGRTLSLFSRIASNRAATNRAGNDEELGEVSSAPSLEELTKAIGEAQLRLQGGRDQLRQAKEQLEKDRQTLKVKQLKCGLLADETKQLQQVLRVLEAELLAQAAEKKRLQSRRDQLVEDQQRFEKKCAGRVGKASNSSAVNSVAPSVEAKDKTTEAPAVITPPPTQLPSPSPTQLPTLVLTPRPTLLPTEAPVQCGAGGPANKSEMVDGTWQKVGAAAGIVEPDQRKYPGMCRPSYAVYLKVNGSGSETAVWFGWSEFDPFTIDRIDGFNRRRTGDRMISRRRCNGQKNCQTVTNPCKCRQGLSCTKYGYSRCSCRTCGSSTKENLQAGFDPTASVKLDGLYSSLTLPGALFKPLHGEGHSVYNAAPAEPTHGIRRVGTPGQCLKMCACNDDNSKTCDPTPEAHSIERIFCPKADLKCETRHDTLKYQSRGFYEKRYSFGTIKKLKKTTDTKSMQGAPRCELSRKRDSSAQCKFFQDHLAIAFGCRKREMTLLKHDEDACKEGGACIQCTDRSNVDTCTQSGSSGTENYCDKYPACPQKNSVAAYGKGYVPDRRAHPKSPEKRCRVIDVIKREDCPSENADRLCLAGTETNQKECDLDYRQWSTCAREHASAQEASHRRRRRSYTRTRRRRYYLEE